MRLDKILWQEQLSFHADYFSTLVGFGQSAAANPTYTDIAGQVGLAKVTPSEGDMPVFRTAAAWRSCPREHGSTWHGMVRNGSGSGAMFSQAFSVLPPRKTATAARRPMSPIRRSPGRDGLVDLICTKGACQGTCGIEYKKELWVQKPEGGFVNLARAAGITQPHARGRDTTALSPSRWPRRGGIRQ